MPSNKPNHNTGNLSHTLEPTLDIPAGKIAIQNNTIIYAQQSLCLHSMHVCVHTTLVICVGMSLRPVCLQILAHSCHYVNKLLQRNFHNISALFFDN